MLFCLLLHASHLIQPLDQAHFGSLKSAWGEASRQHIFHTGEGVGLDSFAGVFHRAWEKSATKEMVEKSFEAAGIYPLNPERVLLAGKLEHGAVFQKQAPSNAPRDTPHVDDQTSTPTPSPPIPTALPPIPSDNPTPPTLRTWCLPLPQIPSNNASFPSSLQEHTGLFSSPAPPTSPSFTMSETVKAMTVEQLIALGAYTVFIQEEIGSRKSMDFLDRLSSTQPQPAEWRSLQKKKNLDNEEAERKKKEKKELAREKKRHQGEEKEAQKRRKEEALVEKKKKNKEEMNAKKVNAKRKKELERVKMKMKKGKRSSYVSSSDSDKEVMEMFMSDIGEEDEVGESKNSDNVLGVGQSGNQVSFGFNVKSALYGGTAATST
ncbi:19.5g1 protein [Plakobranchus ocellatus]|uniref:19.5g1 protein n=1 Tax=Plakobranchus ocellatus TaxID=259542 RepID=A0AAV4DTU9_9GAST|nr:19.5g1 protein [Plakobranchus ocellatus]